MSGTVWAQRMWTRSSGARVWERAYSHLIIQHFRRKWTLIIRNCHSGPTAKATSFRCFWKHPLMRNKRFTVNQQRPVSVRRRAAAEYFRQKSIKWSYWHKTRASLWTGSQREQNDKSLKNRHQYLSSSPFLRRKPGFEAPRLSIFNNLYLWTPSRRAVRWDILVQNDCKSFRFCHYSRGARPWSGLEREQLAVSSTCADKLELSIMSRTRSCGICLRLKYS